LLSSKERQSFWKIKDINADEIKSIALADTLLTAIEIKRLKLEGHLEQEQGLPELARSILVARSKLGIKEAEKENKK
jgi:hypothetical protein